MTPTIGLEAGIEVCVPGTLRDYCRGASTIHVSATSVRGALRALEREYPALYPNICDETGAVRKHIGVFVNTDHIRDLNGVYSSLNPGDVLMILPAVSGG